MIDAWRHRHRDGGMDKADTVATPTSTGPGRMKAATKKSMMKLDMDRQTDAMIEEYIFPMKPYTPQSKS